MMERNLKFAEGFTNQKNILHVGRNFVNVKKDPGKKKRHRIRSKLEAVRYLQTKKKEEVQIRTTATKLCGYGETNTQFVGVFTVKYKFCDAQE